MKLYGFSKKDRDYIQKLKVEYGLHMSTAIDIFLMGGRQHSKELSELKRLGYSDKKVKEVNSELWRQYKEDREVNGLGQSLYKLRRSVRNLLSFYSEYRD